jgi:hypothetical protein
LNCALIARNKSAARRWRTGRRQRYAMIGLFIARPAGFMISPLRQSIGESQVMRNLALCAVGAIAGASMLALSLSPASAFALSGPSLQRSVATSQIDNAWWRRRGWGGGWGPGLLFGGLAAGALAGGYYGGYYGPRYYGYGPGYYGYGPGYYGSGPGECWRDGWGRLHCY